MNSSCWRETLKSDSWKMGTFVWRRPMDIRATRRQNKLTLVWTVNFTFSFSLSASEISIWISWLFGSSESVLECYKDGIVSLWCSKYRQSTFPFGDSTVASADWREMTPEQIEWTDFRRTHEHCSRFVVRLKRFVEWTYLKKTVFIYNAEGTRRETLMMFPGRELATDAVRANSP